ncbi:MAG: low molecular weight phosphotyrosine protein phosphatase [Bacilli bacterium]|nr:low molecular weight phosphotyrosine protein phosphatase [Bacilli bacterium]
MYNVLFICYGNICRSPMAEMIFKDLIIKNNKRYMMSCVSRATSIEEIGNDIYPQAKRKLVQMGVTCESHRATQVTKSDYDKYDYIIVMEERNKRDLLRIIGEDKDNKIRLLLEYTDNIKDIDDPWYSGDFDTAFNEINEGCIGLFNYLVNLGDNNEI